MPNIVVKEITESWIVKAKHLEVETRTAMEMPLCLLNIAVVA